jgi:hypothetical protein
MFPLSAELHRAYVEQITQAGLTAMRIRGCEVSSDSESKTRQEAEGLVQGTYSQCKSSEDMLVKITKMVKKLDPFTQVNTFLLNRPLLTRLVSANHQLVQRDPSLVTSVLKKGEDAATLVMHMDEILKANSLVKAYRLQEAEILAGLTPRVEKLYSAASACSYASAAASAAASAGAYSSASTDTTSQSKQQQQQLQLSNQNQSSLPTREKQTETETERLMLLLQACAEAVPRVAEAVRGLALHPGLQSQISFCVQELSAIVQAHAQRTASAGAGVGVGVWPGDRMKSQFATTSTSASASTAVDTAGSLSKTTRLSLTLCRLLTALLVSHRAAVHATPVTAPALALASAGATPTVAVAGGGGGMGVGAQSNVIAGFPQPPLFNLGLLL